MLAECSRATYTEGEGLALPDNIPLGEEIETVSAHPGHRHPVFPSRRKQINEFRVDNSGGKSSGPYEFLEPVSIERSH